MQKYDICITGGGVAGCACAYISAKLGLKTILIEKNNYLGGLMTGGLVIPVMKTDTSDINTEFYSDLIKYSKDFKSEIEYFDGNKGWFNPNLTKIVLDKMLADVNSDILFELMPDKVNLVNNNIKSINYSSNILSLPIESKYYVDSTGDSKIFKLADLNFYEENEKKQPSSLRFIMSGINIEKLKKFLIKYDKNEDVTNFCTADNQTHLTTAYTWDDKPWGLKPIFEKALKNNDLKPFDTSYFQLFTVPYAPGSIAFNCPRMQDYSHNNPFELSNSLIEARQAIYRISKFVIKYFEGCENAYISQIADITGVRESNKIIAKKQFTIAEMTSGAIPENPILSGDYPVDVHSNKKNSSSLMSVGKYYLEIESLMSKDIENLFAAGRNLGADKKAQGALRTQASCMSMGEGVARHIKNILNK